VHLKAASTTGYQKKKREKSRKYKHHPSTFTTRGNEGGLAGKETMGGKFQGRQGEVVPAGTTKPIIVRRGPEGNTRDKPASLRKMNSKEKLKNLLTKRQKTTQKTRHGGRGR